MVLEINNIHLDKYRNSNLKRRLKAEYSQLRFVKQKQRNQWNWYFRGRSTTAESFSTTTDTETDEDGVNTPIILQSNLKPSWSKSDVLQALYTSPLALKISIKNAPDMQCSWPPTGSDLTAKAAKDMVPT